jgi:hypothetical protein
MSTNIESGGDEKPTVPSDHISLSAAAGVIPGRPATNCVWRWCRKGVIARNGDRVQLEHVRVGGKVLTTRRWIADFTARLTKADLAHFDAKQAAGAHLPARDSRYGAPKKRRPRPFKAPKSPRDDDARIDEELEGEGL